jgi:hypothetical protein
VPIEALFDSFFLLLLLIQKLISGNSKQKNSLVLLMGQSVDKPTKVMFYRSGLSGKRAKNKPAD